MNIVLGVSPASRRSSAWAAVVALARRPRSRPVMVVARCSGAGSVARLAPAAWSRWKALTRAQPLTAEFSRTALRLPQMPRSSARRPTTSATAQGRDERRTRTTTVYSNMQVRPVPDRGCRPAASESTSTAPTSRPSRSSTSRPRAAGRRRWRPCRRRAVSALELEPTLSRKESILAPDIPVFVLGEVQQGGMIGKPAKGSTEQDLRDQPQVEGRAHHSLTKTARWLLIFIRAVLRALPAGLIGVVRREGRGEEGSLPATQPA